MTSHGPVQGPTDPAPWSRPPGHRQPAGHGLPIGDGHPADYRQRAGRGLRRGASFDAKSVSPLDWLAMGSAVVALVFSFFAYYSYHATAVESRTECTRSAELPAEARGLARELCSGATAGAWHGFFGWFGVLLGLLAAGLVAYAVFVHHVNAPVRTRRLAFGAAGLAVLSTLIALVVVPDWPALRSFAASVGSSYSSSEYDKNISNGHGFSYWIVLITLAVLAVAAFLQFRHSDGRTSTSTGEAHPVGQNAYAPSPGHGAPQAPPAGYQPAWQPPPPQQLWAPPGPISPEQPPQNPSTGKQTRPQ